jgi:3-carboxy-cis,cis-muconate cycloisomerase
MGSDGMNSFLFSTPAMTRVFSPAELLRAMTRFEWALSCALESNGRAEVGSGAVLEQLLRADFVDSDALMSEARDAGNVAIPFVRQLTAAVRLRSEVAARSVHLGATSQDVLDTALVLQMRDALKLLAEGFVRLDAALLNQVREHRETMMQGRTWLQPGPPTTLGLKLAGTLSALRRDRERIRATADKALVLQFGGAVGTLASLGTEGGAISADLARLLDLVEPELPWHTQRDNLVAMVQVLAILTGTLAKFGRDVALLMQAEVGEASEGGEAGRGGSSTMPHKHNPISGAALLAIHAKMPGLASTMLHAMPQEHERGLGLWQAEWDTVPEVFRLAAASVAYAIEIAEGLKVDEGRMQANMDATLGLPLAEAVSMALAPSIGRIAAHDLLRRATNHAAKENRRLSDVLKQMPEVKAHLSDAEVDALLDARNYLGSAQRFITRVIGDEDARAEGGAAGARKDAREDFDG